MNRFSTIVLLLLLCLPLITFAEGTKELAPNANITINGTPTNDIAALNLDHPEYHNFASYDNPAVTSRLHIHISDPTVEGIFLGFSPGTRNTTGPNAPNVNFEYRVKDPLGNIVFGPIMVTPGNANASTWQLASTGPAPLFAGGYNPEIVTSGDLTSGGWMTEGDYYIEFRDLTSSDRFLINYWDITVFEGSVANPTERKGRIWSQNWALFAINDFDFPNRPFNGAFYVCAPDPTDTEAAFITKVDFNNSGFRPAAFNIAFNSHGPLNTGNISLDRRSVENSNLTTPEYEIFLNDPVDLCQTAEGGQLDVLGIGRCTAKDFCIRYTATRPGQIDLILDFHQKDGVFTPGTEDRLIAINVDSNEVNKPICLDWDGKDGLGMSVLESGNTKIPIIISYAQGIYHFPIYDAELLTDGFNITSVRPTGPTPRLFYDDSDISVPSGSGEPSAQLTGCTLPCHTWTNYTGGAIVGFGNLNTINSWWFSQQIVETFEFNLPTYMECSIEGIDELCPDEEGILRFTPKIVPADGTPPGIVTIEWNGPNIVGAIDKDSVIVQGGGIYKVGVTWVNALGDTCYIECSAKVEQKDEPKIFIDTLILRGDTAIILDEPYYEGGIYNTRIEAEEDCDTLVTINVRIIETILHYDFDSCKSYVADSTHQEYIEFEPEYPAPISCADVSAEFLRRENPVVNPHSCTPGVNGTIAMCVSSLDSCDFDAGNEKSVVFEVTLDPAQDTAVAITGLCFYERAPEDFDWIDGLTGLNNFPTKYGLRVLKNGSEIFRVEDVPTSNSWSKQTYDFKDLKDFSTDQKAVYRFELLGYCLNGDSSEVTAWDLDELTVFASCISPSATLPYIGGQVSTIQGEAFPFATVKRASHSGAFDLSETDAEGQYLFKANETGKDYILSASSADDPLNGVSTKDVIYITRHLLGKETFKDAYQYLAGDVNLSSAVSISDVAELRKLILGKTTNFSHGQSWRFGPTEQSIEVNNVWDFKASHKVTADLEDQMNQDFVAIKLGDINGNAVVSGNSVVTRGNKSVILSYEVTEQADGASRVDLYLEESMIQGFQAALNIADDYRILNGQIALTDQDIYHDGQALRLSFINDGRVINSNLPIFSIITQNASSELRTLEAVMASEIYFGDELETRLMLLQKRSDTGSKSMQVSVFPNPAHESINFRISNAASKRVSLTLFDVNGRALLQHEEASTKDLDLIQLQRDLLPSGLNAVFYRIGDGVDQRYGRIILID